MRDQLLDIVRHTHGYGFIDEVKVTVNEGETHLTCVSDDKAVIFMATLHSSLPDLSEGDIFGLPNLHKLNIILNIPEYTNDKDSKITLMKRNEFPAGLRFENSSGDFSNEYRFMAKTIVESKIKNVSMNQVNWNIEFKPTDAAVKKLKMQIAANSEVENIKVSTQNNNLVFSFGDQSTHAGSFVFQNDVNGELSNTWCWPVTRLSKALDLVGDTKIQISDRGVLGVQTDSGLGMYHYYLPGSPE